jgi:hypothetical protein
MTYAQKKILFFTAASKPTTQENTDINIMLDLGFNVGVRAAPAYAKGNVQGGTLETADYAMDSNAGATIPAAFSGLSVASKTAPPAPPLLSTQRVITSGVEFAGNDKTGTYINGWTPTIVAGAVSTMLAS